MKFLFMHIFGEKKWNSDEYRSYCRPDRAISNQICDERTKFDILYAFVNVSLCLTHRKHSIQRALDSPGSGERFKYVERARKVYRKFFRDI